MYYAYGDYVYALLSYSSEFLWSNIFVKFAVSDYKNLSKFSCQQPIYIAQDTSKPANHKHQAKLPKPKTMEIGSHI